MAPAPATQKELHRVLSAPSVLISGPQLTFSTKILGPLLKSKLLSPKDLVVLASTSRAVLMGLNVQDASCLIVPLEISRPEVVDYLNAYFALKQFSAAPQTNKRRSTLTFGRRKSLAAAGGAADAEAGKPAKQRMTAWRFATCKLRGDKVVEAFCAMLASESSPAAATLKTTLQTIILQDTRVDLTKLLPLSRSLRGLHLVRFALAANSVPAFPVLREVVFEDCADAAWTLKAATLSLVSKVETLRVRSDAVLDPDSLSMLADLKSLSLSGACTGQIPKLAPSTKLRDVMVTDVREQAGPNVGAMITAAAASSAAMRTVHVAKADIAQVPEFGPNSTVSNLSLVQCPALHSLAGANAFSGLTHVNLTGCTALTDASALSLLPKLSRADFSGCERLGALSGLSQCSELVWLNLSGTPVEDATVAGLAQCEALQTLILTNCGIVTSLEHVCGPKLRRLVAKKCSSLAQPPANAPALEFLDLSSSAWVKNISSLETCPLLATVLVASCGRLNTLAPLAKLELLQELDCTFATVDGMEAVVAACKCLRVVTANAHDSVTSLGEAFGASRAAQSPVRALSIGTWRMLQNCDALAMFSATLEVLELPGSNIENCSALAPLKAMRYLRLSNSRSLVSVQALTKCTALVGVDLSHCPALVDASPLGKCPLLTWANLSSCDSLAILKGIEENNLRRLDLFGSERGVFRENDSIRTVLAMEFTKLAGVLYSRDEARQWGGPSYGTILAEMTPKDEPDKKGGGGGGCAVC